MRTINQTESPFNELIARFVEQKFPTQKATGGDALELVFAEWLGTKQTRNGPKPAPEAQVAQRAVIRHWIENKRPIPVMVPWGSEKPDGSGVDVAEIAALKQLECLQMRVQAHYAPGLDIVLRIEDLSAPYQFFQKADIARAEAEFTRKGWLI